MKVRKLILIGLVFFIGCTHVSEEQSRQHTMSKPAAVSNESDIEVVRVSVIQDDTAYNQIRGVYRIYDKKTGKEYLGVSGIGISENGQHRAGKATIRDER